MTATDKINSMIRDPRFAAAVIGMIVIALQDLLGITIEQTDRIQEIVGVWIAGHTINKTGLLFGSRRFWWAMVGAGLVIAQPHLNLSNDQITGLTRFAELWILGDALHKTGVANSVFTTAFVK